MAVKFVKGSDVTLTVNLVDQKTKDPFSLTGFSGATAYFAAEDGGDCVGVTGSVVSADCGKMQFVMNESTTELLAAGDAQDVEIVVDKGSDRTIVQILGSLQIVDRIC
jgi:hypothetical protein